MARSANPNSSVQPHARSRHCQPSESVLHTNPSRSMTPPLAPPTWANSVSARDLLHQPADAGTERPVAEDALVKRLTRVLDDLSEHDRLILNLYYTEQLTPQEVSFVLEDSELHVMQLHRAALLKLRALLRTHGELAGSSTINDIENCNARVPNA